MTETSSLVALVCCITNLNVTLAMLLNLSSSGPGPNIVELDKEAALA